VSPLTNPRLSRFQFVAALQQTSLFTRQLPERWIVALGIMLDADNTVDRQHHTNFKSVRII